MFVSVVIVISPTRSKNQYTLKSEFNIDYENTSTFDMSNYMEIVLHKKRVDC